ncbi:Flp pilus assembly protein CpaB [Arthrobacter sp. APC 3897]|jgi:Flp pilus assembly protein CpaB|uniref:Flp pilus assembly protein CpaB n=1 Tax=Arthrobacter sp. APC 3897 TaxID=3035204 RepID=UPI0025B3525C|nr:Flp pilus assembly protein CpaB [Arthrobacter sp. APC 3897]MDN3482190.1 Flp pilus assembly protein CpaB [Arthrobacter sp. APC 3897]
MRRFLLRRRRLLAALLFCAAAGTAVQALLPPAAGEVSVVVSAADLPAGAVLTSRDLRTITVPAAAVPPGSFAAPGQTAGRRLATALQQGSPVLQTSLVGSGLLTGAPPGSVAVAVRPADPAMAGLLVPGQLVDVVLAGPDGLQNPDGPVLLAAGTPILWTAAADGAAAWPGSAETDALVVLAAAPDQAAALAAASGSGQVHLVLTGG